MGIDFLGYNLFDGNVAQCSDEMVAAAHGEVRKCRVMACMNPHSYTVARTDEAFRRALQLADWLLPDGSGVVLATRLLNLGITDRVTGPDTFLAVMRRLDAQGGSVYFLGSTDEVLAKIRVRMTEDFPNVVVTGTYSPPYKPNFSEDDNAAIRAAVNTARPDVLWVGMTAPKQEKWLAENRAFLNVGAAGAVGAAFDFFAGTVKRSPTLFRTLGLEWLPRLVQQPRSLWRRMLVSAPIFLADVVREVHHKKRG